MMNLYHSKEEYRLDLIRRAKEHAKTQRERGAKTTGVKCTTCYNVMSANEVFYSSDCQKCNFKKQQGKL